MNRILIAAAMATLLGLTATGLYAQSGTIYSWTDENGVKHYSDRAPEVPAAGAEMVKVDTSVPPGKPEAAVDAPESETLESSVTAQATDKPGKQLSYADQQRLAMQEKRKAKQEQATERNQLCLQARDQLAQVEPSRRVFYTDENGDTVRLDDDQRMQMVDESKALIAQYCD
jgi:hypothetical protein